MELKKEYLDKLKEEYKEDKINNLRRHALNKTKISKSRRTNRIY